MNAIEHFLILELLLIFDPRIDDYIFDAADFVQPVLRWLRHCIHSACPEVEESIKWRMPFFSYKGRPLAGMAAFKNHATFGFWQRYELATGKEGSAMGQFGKLKSVSDLPTAPELRTMVREAMTLIDSGIKEPRPRRLANVEVPVPEELQRALANDQIAALQFNAFPPGARRDYCDWISDAKRPETRSRRITQALIWLKDGKKRNWKYEPRK
ncbi:YdeI/OmpD-associated family protein [Brucella pseudogrignonensis]